VGRGPVIAALAAVAAGCGVWLAGIHVVPEGRRGLQVSGGAPVRELEPGRHWAFPGRVRVVAFPVEDDTLRFPPPGEAYRLFDAEDRELPASFLVRYHAVPGDLAAAYKSTGEAVADSLRARLRDNARLLAAQLSADDPRSTTRLANQVEARAQFPGWEVSVRAASPGATGASGGDQAPRETGVSLLVVGIDSGDWRNIDPLIEAGRMPNLAGLLERGARADLGSLKPMLSPLLWTTMATGVLPDKHGILDFLTLDPATGQPTPVSRRQRREPAIWNMFTQYGVSQGVVGWLATWPAEQISGYLVSDRFGFLAFASPQAGDGQGMTWPPEYATTARGLEVKPTDLDASFWSRFADMPPADLAAAAARGFEKGDIAGNLALTLATALTNTAITEDIHARAAPRFLTVYYEMVDAAGHLVMPYAPPRRPGVSEADYKRFSGTMDAVYAFQDELLGRLLALADDNTVVMVLSDHGFRSGDDRPSGSAEIWGGEAARWHREPGILVLAGPGVRRGVRLEKQAELLDIAPTMLAILGVPVPASMTGRFVTEAFTPEGQTRYAPQPVPALDLRPEVWTRPPAAAPVTGSGSVAATYHNNLGLVLETQGKLAEAEAEYRQALASDPQDRMAQTNLGGVLVKTGRLDEAGRILEAAAAEHPDNTPTRFNLGFYYQRRERFADAEKEYRAVLAQDPAHITAKVNLGHMLLRQGKRDEAAVVFREALARNPGDVNAHFGLGLVATETGDYATAEKEFRRTLELDPQHGSAAANLAQVEKLLREN